MNEDQLNLKKKLCAFIWTRNDFLYSLCINIISRTGTCLDISIAISIILSFDIIVISTFDATYKLKVAENSEDDHNDMH